MPVAVGSGRLFRDGSQDHGAEESVGGGGPGEAGGTGLFETLPGGGDGGIGVSVGKGVSGQGGGGKVGAGGHGGW